MAKGKKVNSERADRMLYQQFISTYAREYELTVPQATRMIESVFELLKHTVIRQGVVNIRGVGTFVTRKRKTAKAKNYGTGQTDELVLRKVIKFLPSLSFKKSLNDKVHSELERYIKKQAVIKRELIYKGVIQKKDNKF